MRQLKEITLSNIQSVYSGPEGDLWELIMGEQIHIGGLQSSMDRLQLQEVSRGRLL